LSEFLCNGSAVKDTVLEELKCKILAELPEELAFATSFKLDLKASGLVLDFAVKLTKADYPLVLGLLRSLVGTSLIRRIVRGKIMDASIFLSLVLWIKRQ
jgi:hypothetical protein